MKKLTTQELFDILGKDLILSKITDEKTFSTVITNPYINRPGLALTGYFERFSYDRVQILGDPEVGYIQRCAKDKMYDVLKKMFTYNIPCLFFSKGNTVPSYITILANESNIPIIQTPTSTDDLMNLLSQKLGIFFSPRTIEHSTFLDIYGAGVLITGKSGVGKSESALDLIERGHRLVCDDSTSISRMPNGTLIGTSTREDSSFMEIRGIGIVDIQKMFGIQAIKNKKTLHMIIELVPYNVNKNYDSINTERLDNKKFRSILQVPVPLFQLPVSPGKNMSILIETAVLNFLSISMGYDAAKTYIEKQKNFFK